MPVDAGIYGQIRQPQQRNMLADYAQALQIGDMQQNQEMNRLRADEYRRGVQRQDALTNLYSSTPQNELENKLLTSGYAKESFELGKQRRENLKTDAETANKTVDTQIKMIERTASALSQATDQNSYNVVRQSLISQFGPQIGSRLPEVFEPAQVQALVAQGLTRAQQLTDERTRQQNAETARHNRASEGLQGANVALRRQELEFNKSQPKGQFLETPQGYVLADPRGGTVAPVVGPDGKQLKGKSADKSLTDAQAKANLFGTRMKESDRILGSLEGQYSPMAVNAKMGAEKFPLIGGMTGYAANKMLTDEGQQAEQAQRDFINAVLRRESGAVISEPEFENAKRQYFPQPGDSDAVLKQKRANRALAINGMEAEVPGGFRAAPSLTNPGSAPSGFKVLGVEGK